jgi:hypothetical protein
VQTSQSQAGWPPCWMCWHTKCYKCMGIGMIPMKMHQDAQGNSWFKQKQKEDEINRGVNGAHELLCPFNARGAGF